MIVAFRRRSRAGGIPGRIENTVSRLDARGEARVGPERRPGRSRGAGGS